MPENQALLTRKIVLVGDSGVGKSCLAERFAQKDFDRKSKPTLGANLVIALANVNSEKTKLRILDTAGQERYRAPCIPYDGAAGVMLVYDITSRQTFENIARWLGEVRKHAHKDVNLILVGNKTDLGSSRTITCEEGSSFACMTPFSPFDSIAKLTPPGSEGLNFTETSAAEGNKVEAAFEALVSVINT